MKFSFVVIGHNQKNEICTAIDSVLNQTYQNVEVIYVDDASTDATAEFVHAQYCDERLKIVVLQENVGPMMARLTGVDHATGDWLLYLDGDDSYYLHTCQTLADAIHNANRPVDIIGYGAELVCGGNISETERTVTENAVGKPCLGYWTAADVMEAMYLRGEKSYSLWNKCYSMPLARRVASTLVRDKLYYSEDYYMNFVTFSIAENYLGISNLLYRYSYGVGISTRNKISLGAFERTLTGSKSHRYTEQFAKQAGLYEKYRERIKNLDRDVLLKTYDRLSKLDEADKARATDKLFEAFCVKHVLTVLEECTWIKSSDSAKHLDVSAVFPYSGKQIRTVAMFVERMYGGGIERVVQMLMPVLRKAGYRVILITDELEHESDFTMQEGTERIALGVPDVSDKMHAYSQRFDRIIELVKNNQIDAVIYHSWLSEQLFFDMCAIKSAGAAFLVHTHSAFYSRMYGGDGGCLDAAHIYRHADGVIVSNDVDQFHWSAYNRKVFCVDPPLSIAPVEMPQAGVTNHTLLWVGRFDPMQKNPFDGLEIFRRVLDVVPDAKMYIVGTGSDDVVRRMNELAERLQLQEHVTFTGYVNDVSEYYKKATVCLLTSNYEDFSMTCAEALSHGVPIVAYPLPYMAMAERSKALIQVEWKNIGEAAEVIIELFSNEEERQQMSQEACKEAALFEDASLGEAWKDVFNCVEHDSAVEYVPSQDTIHRYRQTVELSMTQMTSRVAQLAEENAQLSQVYQSKRYRLGSFLIEVPKRLIKLILRR